MKDFYERVYSQDNPEGDAHGWIQWKGTKVCMDVHCSCGAMSHIDEDFCYFIECPSCGKKYAVGQNVKLIPLNADQARYAEESGCGVKRPHDN